MSSENTLVLYQQDLQLGQYFVKWQLAIEWPMFSENTLMWHQQDLQLGQYFVKWQLAIYRGLPRIILQNNYSGPKSRLVQAAENLR